MTRQANASQTRQAQPRVSDAAANPRLAMGQSDAATSRRVILMRGLPSCGKTTTARQIAGARGFVCEFDEYFYTQVGDDPRQYDWNRDLLDAARRWNLARFIQAVDAGVSPIVVDNCNGPSLVTKQYAVYALANRYSLTLREPDSPWWAEIRTLLADKRAHRHALIEWAKKLSVMSKGTHHVPLSMFLHRIKQWRNDVTIKDILRTHATSDAPQAAAHR